jgi:ribonucleoside-diphosphate reductase alpha chain
MSMSLPFATDDSTTPTQHGGLTVERHWTTEGVHPFDEVEWELRTALIGGEGGDVVFEQEGVEFPAFWSQQATNVVASRYFRGTMGTLERERSVKQLIGRVVTEIGRWSREQAIFATVGDAEAFQAELTWLLLHQRMSFNSPVWFNVGVEAQPQCSACFINSVEDTLDSILTLARTEGMLFKFGSGTGTNLSPIRSSVEGLSGGGEATGPLSFMRGYDAFAGAIKSGGKTRRAAKMVILNASHPDVEEFVESKAHEEAKARALIAAGYDGSFGGEAYNSVFFQNANHSVRVTDAFMEAVVDDRDWDLRSVVTSEPLRSVRARDLMNQIADAAWRCGDPGLQFDTTANTWHTCPETGRINASNPCSEYMFLDDSACNLASLNLLSFSAEAPGAAGFDVAGFAHAARLTLLAQEILVGQASYPTPKIGVNSLAYRPLGLGYANLGALLMSWGLPYDSEAGRGAAAAITAIMCGEAYAMSARIAEVVGPFEGYAANSESMLAVMRMHRAAARDIRTESKLADAAQAAWDDAVDRGTQHGYRNAQATVLAPTGTIAFMMDCDTTGIEPDIALVKYKRLSGGGMLRIVNQTVARALERLGYDRSQVHDIVKHVDDNDTIEGAPHLKDVHLPVFDCAFRSSGGTRSIAPMGHVRMMSAAQPFLSGAISKTVNLPPDATVADIREVYVTAWRAGLKAVAVYRDGCKAAQPLSTSGSSASVAEDGRPRRQRLPDERQSITHKFDVGGHQGYITVGIYPDGLPGEIFVVMAKQGSTVGGLMDSFATSVSLSLQYGVPLSVLSRKFIGTRFEPSGFTTNSEIPLAKSIMDYIFRWLTLKFPAALEPDGGGQVPTEPSDAESVSPAPQAGFILQTDAPPCADCGSLMVPNGSCYKCLNCGGTSGCS